MYSGLLGKLMIESKEIGYISNWSVEDTTDVIEITQLGKEYKEKKAGLQSWSASADGAVDFTSTSGQVELFTAKHAGTKVKCDFYLYIKSGKPSVFFSGYGYIESLSVDLSAEDKGNISISISGTGKLISPTAHESFSETL